MKISGVEPILMRTPLVLDDAIPNSGGVPKKDVYTLLVRGMPAVPQEPGLGNNPDLRIVERMRVA